MGETPTQVAHPARAVIRTLFAAVVGLAALIPVVIAASGVPTVGAVAVVLTVCGAVTRVLADPRVNAFLTIYVPWLSAEPPKV